MKKLTLLFAAVAMLCSKNACAQDDKGSINFVPYVGVNYSDFSEFDTERSLGCTSGKLNFMVGGRFEFQILKNTTLLVDYNYRRLGATISNYALIVGYPIDDSYYTWINVGKEEPTMFQFYKQKYQKVTRDCHTLGLQFKQNIVAGLSARVGIEATISAADNMHTHNMEMQAMVAPDYLIQVSVGNIISIAGNNPDIVDDTGWSEYDEAYSKYETEGFSDHLNTVIPIGVTYDYKNFSLNATYHLPITSCSNSIFPGVTYTMKQQAFDFTIGYRLPLRKR